MAQEKRRFLYTQQAKVAFKGVGQEVHVILDSQASFAEIERELEEHLERSGRFFVGAAVKLIVGSRQLRDEQLHIIRRTLATYGLTIAEIQADLAETMRPSVPSPPPVVTYTPPPQPQSVGLHEPSPRESELPQNNAVLVRGPLRSGQRVYADAHLVVFGDVNPGAELIAAGDIMVMGVLRGVAHAGVPDNMAAIIAAISLKPTQLRIGHFISRSPEFQEKHDSGPEIARVDAEQIVVESFPRRLLGAS
jgi:septum site-determining protein MinC